MRFGFTKWHALVDWQTHASTDPTTMRLRQRALEGQIRRDAKYRLHMTIEGTAKSRNAAGGSLLDYALASLRGRSKDLQARGLLHVAVFGSVARREDGPDSDLDLMAEVGPEVGTLDVMELEELLAQEIGRKVQIITRSGLDNVRHAEIFRDMTPAF